MKCFFYLRYFLLVGCVLLTGCLFKTGTVATRHFILSPACTNELAQAAPEHLSVSIGLVKMPSYLLRNSVAVRNGANEIEYLETAQWGERLDQCFQRAVAANLSRLLSSDGIHVADWGRDHAETHVFINVQQFDVDNRGHGTLIAYWRIVAPGSDVPLKTGQARLYRTGASPRGNPQAIATTLSDLAADFSRDLAATLEASD
jgi:uncharacterized lipoprotein YmbA